MNNNPLKIRPKEHFFVQGLKRAFELSAIPAIYEFVSKNLDSIRRNEPNEWCIGTSTIVYSVDDNNTIHLITGWVGSRNKEAKNG
ncbi:hypothetical protein [Sulfurimonas sp.]|uniref:hypothetical protein n=1 Tax=Sulfurimonas sp. TaxID=2022749 RepID=UPI0025FEF04D|nr:hypothetical protein [Sulfurimonas sp.]MBW6487503.1 hypothetical protein [Sulfurimonas sp.]